jgi:anti-sigma regulatory factor (Ser/Thr protein kinase)
MERHLAVRRDLADLAQIQPWVEQLAEAGGWSRGASFAVQLCLEEALANIIMHGAMPAEDAIEVAVADPDGDDIVLSVESRGTPFDSTGYPEPAAPGSLAEAGLGGQGIRLMRRFATSMRYERAGDRDRLELIISKG